MEKNIINVRGNKSNMYVNTARSLRYYRLLTRAPLALQIFHNLLLGGGG